MRLNLRVLILPARYITDDPSLFSQCAWPGCKREAGLADGARIPDTVCRFADRNVRRRYLEVALSSILTYVRQS